MEDSNTIEFSFGHKSFTFPKETLSYYEWLSNLFGHGIIGTSKNKLDYNLIDYCKTFTFKQKNNTIIALTQLQKYYLYDKPIVNPEFVEKVDEFLQKGPGIQGFDIPYTCKKCNLSCFTKPKPKTILPHKFVVSNKDHKSCIYCSFTIPTYNDRTKFCGINDTICDHDFE